MVSVGAGADHEAEHPTDVAFDAPVPCVRLCTHLESHCDIECDEEWMLTAPCGPPLSAVSQGTLVIVAPVGASVLRFELFPVIDSDSYVCEFEDEHDHDGKWNELLSSGANVTGENCNNVLGYDPVPIGCRERTELNVKAGRRYVLTVFNNIDLTPIRGRYVFMAPRLPEADEGT